MMIDRIRLSFPAIAVLLAAGIPAAQAADVTVQPTAGSGFVVKDAGGASERLRVQESGAVSLPGIVAAPVQAQGLCIGAAGQLGPCSSTGSGSSYAAGTGLALAGTTFSVAPTYRLPQNCATNQFAQWNGGTWVCGNAGGGAALPPGTVNQTLRYDASNALVANNLLQAFSDGGLVAGGTQGTGSIPASGNGMRMMWYPAKAAFRVGGVNSPAWDDANVGGFSVAMGQNSIASGDISFSMGVGTVAQGLSSVALGDRTFAGGKGATAMGSGTSASGDYSTALGNGSVTAGMNAFAAGNHAIANAPGAVALGSAVSATASGSIALGTLLTADGEGSILLGNGAIAGATNAGGHSNVFVFSDGGNPPTPTQDKVFYASAFNGFVFSSGDDASRMNFTMNPINGATFVTGNGTGANLAKGSGSWTSLSDRNAKTAVREVDPREILEKVAALPLNTWQYKAQDAKYRHIGPMAQDFYAAFHLGESDKGIDVVDADGVALAAIQGLNALLAEKDAKANARLDAKDREIAALRAELVAQKMRAAELESLAADLAEVKAQVAALRKPSHAAVAMTVASRRP